VANPGARALVTLRPDALRDPNLDNPTVGRWFDPFAFAAPGLERFGSAGRGIIVVRERVRIRLEGLATNLLNRPNYDLPILNITEALNPNLNPAAVTSGRVTNVINRNVKFDSAIPRELQLQFRVEF
jgi:hypothetical protein